jgi:hypothetical protein
MIGVEGDGADFYSLGSDVFFLELSGDVSLDEGGFADSSISDEDDFELGYWFSSLHNKIVYLHVE